MNELVVHFSHANGIPSLTYSYLFEQLTELLNDEQNRLHLTYIKRMGYERPTRSGNWYDMADELITSIEKGQQQRQSKQPIIGVGHSAGAVVTLMAASKRPELFSHVVILDPPLFSRRKRYVIGVMRKAGFMHNMKLVKQARVRRNRFASLNDAREYFKPKALFKDFHPRCFEDYVKHGLTHNGHDFELAIEPEHESQIFYSIISRAPKGLHNVKGTLIYGSSSDAVDKSDVRWWRKNMPLIDVRTFDGAHLFPLEQPDKTVQWLKDAILKG